MKNLCRDVVKCIPAFFSSKFYKRTVNYLIARFSVFYAALFIFRIDKILTIKNKYY